MTVLGEELKKLRYGLVGGASDDDFVGRVMKNCVSEPVLASPRWAPSRFAYVGATVAAAACAVLALTRVASVPEPVVGRQVTARGGAHEGLRVTVQAFVGHAAPGTAAPLLEGASLRPGDGILVRYSNPGSERVYLMVFALDARNDVHWLHPAYLDERTNPTGLALGTFVTERVLPEVAEPEGAAPGLLRVYALLSRAPLDVKAVEAKLSNGQGAPPEVFPEAEVEEWRCTWTP